MSSAYGLDFGTSNSALGWVQETATRSGVGLVQFDLDGAAKTDTFRSVLHFDPDERDARGRAKALAGPRALARYLKNQSSGRLIQSVKSYLADTSFSATDVYGRNMTVVDLLAEIVIQLREQAEQQGHILGKRIVCGRPVRFAHAETEEDEALALTRLREALGRAGFDEVLFEFEPVGAAYFYETTLAADELVLIGDFGGGTSDFTILEVGPGLKHKSERTILSTSGVAIAGDLLDASIMDHVVAGRLGKGSHYRQMLGANDLDVPPWIYTRLRRWHHLSFLKSARTLKLLNDIETGSDAPEQIAALRHIIEDDLGFSLAQAVEATKRNLSSTSTADLRFVDEPCHIEATVARVAFEQWIAESIDAMRSAVGEALTLADVDRTKIDRVFLTGGSSKVPAVRGIFEAMFGRDKVASGYEFSSVASGLALRACY